MYIPKHFKAYELVPPDVFQKHGDTSLYFMDDRILWTLDALRERVGVPITVNNWKKGGQFYQRGYRSDQAVGAPYSMHRFGRAVDFDIAGMSAEDFRSRIKIDGMFLQALIHITRIEDLTNWIHIDCAGLPRQQGEPILFFKP